MAFNYENEDYFTAKHNNRVEAMFNAAKAKRKTNPCLIDEGLTEGFNPLDEVEVEVRISKEEGDMIDKLFGCSKR